MRIDEKSIFLDFNVIKHAVEERSLNELWATAATLGVRGRKLEFSDSYWLVNFG